MIILIVGVLLLLYGILSEQKFSVGVGILFVLLIMGFQEGVPGDFDNYKYAYEHGGIDFGLVSYLKETEYAYQFLVRFFSFFISFHGFVLITSTAQCVILADLIKNHANRRYQFFGVLLVFFTYNIMLMQMKAMRQGYGVDVLILAYLLLDRRKYFWSLITAAIACGFHNTCLYTIPFYLVFLILHLVNRNKDQEEGKELPSKTRITLLAPLLIAVGLMVFYFLKYYVLQSYITPILEGWELVSYEGYIEEMDVDNAIAWWILFYYFVSAFCISMYLFKERDTFKKYMAVLVIISYFITIGVFGYGNLQRIVMYFVTFSVVVLPNVAAFLRGRFGSFVANGYIVFNMAFLMLFSVIPMLSNDFSSGTGFGSYTFSFLDW